MFSRNQEACREKWLATEKECTGLKKELDESQANKEKLECQIRYITDLLKHEIHIRQKLQKEERDLVNAQFVCRAMIIVTFSVVDRRGSWPW